MAVLITTVDPTNIPKKLTRLQLESWVLFGVLVCNKEADSTWRKLHGLQDALAEAYPLADSPFHLVECAITDKRLMEFLKAARVGQYTRIERAFREVIHVDLKHLTVEALEAVHGIGPKTARMIVLYSDPNSNAVPLDTHVLKYLRALGYPDVPKNTPSAGPIYRKWEDIFVEEAAKAGMSVREFDTKVWQMYAVAFKKKRAEEAAA